MVRRLAALAGRLLLLEGAAVLVLAAYLAVHLLPIVFNPPPPALAVQVNAACMSREGSTPCYASVTRLASGRYRIATDVPASSLTIYTAPPAEMRRAQVMLIRASSPALTVDALPIREDGTAAPPQRFVDSQKRTLAPIAAGSAPVDRVFLSAAQNQRLIIDELAFYESDRGLLNDDRLLFPGIPAVLFYATLLPRALLPFCLLTIVVALIAPAHWLRRINPPAIALACFAFSLLDLAILYSPYASGDLRVFYAAGPLQQPAGNNLNEAFWQAWRFLHGNGLTIVPRVVPWERMPGYSLFTVIAALLFGHGTLLDIAISTVMLQVAVYAAAAGVLAWAAARLWPPAVVWTVGLLIALLPKQLGYTQVDSIIAPIAMLVTAALCVWLSETAEGRPASVRTEVAVHAGFALWFVMRPDVLPAWGVVSLILHGRNWRRLAIPVAFAAAICISWGAYKRQYTHEFVPTTSSLGATLLCGLWEVPSRFPRVCADDQYFTFVSAHTELEPKTQAASNFTLRQVVRFWLTYPGHVAIMVNHKVMEFLDHGAWPGFHTDLQRNIDTQRVVARVLGRPVVTLALLTVVGLSFALGYRHRETLLLGWPLFFGAPMFLMMQASGGRYYSAVPIALLAITMPRLLDAQFYRAIVSRPMRALVVVGVAIAFSVTAWPIHTWLLHNDAFHYWTPILDPSKALLASPD